MPIDIGATGFIGVAPETTVGTYVAPTLYFPIKSENFQFMQDNTNRRLIRAIADNLGVVAGYSHVEGTIECELMEDVLAQFLQASRHLLVKTGTTPNWIYTTTPGHGAALPTGTINGKSLSITVVRDGVTHGFTGCYLSQLSIGVDNGVGSMSAQFVGLNEASQSLPTAAFNTTTPFGPGMWSIEVPTATPILTVDNFSLTMNDNAVPENRLASVRTPQFVRFGERNVELSLEKDFTDRTELDAFKALTAASVTVTATKGANNSVSFKLAAATRDTYEIGGLSGQGDLVRANVGYQGVFDTATSKALEFVIKSQLTLS